MIILIHYFLGNGFVRSDKTVVTFKSAAKIRLFFEMTIFSAKNRIFAP